MKAYVTNVILLWQKLVNKCLFNGQYSHSILQCRCLCWHGGEMCTTCRTNYIYYNRNILQSINGLAQIRVAPFNNTMLQVCHRANHHTELLLIFLMLGSDIKKKYWKFHNDAVNSFGVMGEEMPYFSLFFVLRCLISDYHIFKQLSPQHKSTGIIHRLLITLHIWFRLIYRSFDANHMQNYQTVALHKNTDFVTHFSKNVDAILL